jgi:chromosome segregation ATPase
MRKWILTGACCLVFGGAQALDLDQLKAQAVADLANAQEAQNQARNALLDLQRQESLVDARDATLKPQVESWKGKREHVAAERERYQQTVSEHNARCSGTYPEQSYVDQCNRRKADLDAWKSALIGRTDAINAERQQLVQQLTAIDSDRERIRANMQRNQGVLQAATQRAEKAQETLRRIQLSDRFLADPRMRNKVSRECDQAPTLEDQVQCMESVFDGARAKN